MPYTASHFRELVSGRQRGIGAALLRGMLRTAELPYSWTVQLRNYQYNTGRKEIYRAPVPVVSVGNLTLGGTGKTPLVEWLARWFTARGVSVTIISRGYGKGHGSGNDESLELQDKLPDVPHLQNPNRSQAARAAVVDGGCQLILLDDAFQHRRIARDLDIVLIDALEPFGFDHVFPRGTLREPVDGLSRADVIGLTRSDVVDQQQRQAIRKRVSELAPRAIWLELIHAPQYLLSSENEEKEIHALAGQRVAAFCGIGNPAGFRHTVTSCGMRLVAFREFPDHHNYQPEDLVALGDWVRHSGDVDALVCTHKDLVKIPASRLGDRPLWALVIGVDFPSGQAELGARLDAVLNGKNGS